MHGASFTSDLKSVTHIPPARLSRVRQYVTDPAMQMEALESVSHTAAALGMWVHAVAMFARVTRTPRVAIFGGKSAPGYVMAKQIIKLIHDVGKVVNNDADVGDLLKVVYIPNYNVSLAELIVPASDLSEHISTAGMEASGTSNMKFAMNGGLIIGTLDGANIEIAREIGEENMFIFGASADEVPGLRHDRQFGPPSPPCEELAAVFDWLSSCDSLDRDVVNAVVGSLSWSRDYYLVTHDFKSYLGAQERVDDSYSDPSVWARMSIMSTAGMGYFSTDRTIQEYAERIWDVSPCRRPNPVTEDIAGVGRVRSFPHLLTPRAHAPSS